MSSADVAEHSVEDQENTAPQEEVAQDDEPHIAADQVEGAVEPAAANDEEQEEDAGEEGEEGDLSDPRVFKIAAREVDECYMSVIRGLSAFSQEDEEIYGNAVDICNDIITMEQNLFSEAPSYISEYLASFRAKTDKYNSTVQPHQTIPTAEGAPRDWEERRAYVDPGVPLMLPYDADRFKKEHPDRMRAEGTYHDLFYGDGTQVVFAPPADNKRAQIEEEQKKYPRPSRQQPYHYDPPQKKPMRVSEDFVPACAEVKDPFPVKRTRPAAKAQPKKAQKKSVSKK